jgi:phosphatidyl-myo-inositol dimannoside synthase
LNVTILTTDSIPLIGGVSDYLHGFCCEINKRVSVKVYSTVPSTPQYDTNIPYFITRIINTRLLGERFGDSLSALRKYNSLRWYLKRPAEARRLVSSIFEESSPDVLFVGRWEERSHFWCRACLNQRIPYNLFAYGMDLLETKSPRWREKRRQDFLHAHNVISISTATSGALVSLGVPTDRIFLLPPGIRPEEFPRLSLTDYQKVMEQLDLAGHRFLLTLCRLIRRKGVDLTIRAFADIADQFPDVCLVIAGDGPEAPTLRSLAHNLNVDGRVRFLGQVDEATKRALFQGCEFFVMPNRPTPGDMEGFGIVFLEAAMYGKAVIGGNNGGVPDAVVDGQTGYLIDTSNSRTPLSQAIISLLTNPERAKQMGHAGEERARRDFVWESLCTQFLAALPKFTVPMVGRNVSASKFGDTG